MSKLTRPRVTLSLTRDLISGARVLAIRDGHDQLTQTVQELLTKRLREEFGPDWRAIVAAKAREMEIDA